MGFLKVFGLEKEKNEPHPTIGNRPSSACLVQREQLALH